MSSTTSLRILGHLKLMRTRETASKKERGWMRDDITESPASYQSNGTCGTSESLDVALWGLIVRPFPLVSSRPLFVVRR